MYVETFYFYLLLANHRIFFPPPDDPDLKAEWGKLRKKGERKDYTEEQSHLVLAAIENMKIFKRKGPRQESGYDCGLCLVENLKEVIKALFFDDKGVEVKIMNPLLEEWET